jgi:hypothetical protein
MVESISTISKPARIRGVATARIPSGAVASELENDGKKNTIFFDVRTLCPSPVVALISIVGPCRGDCHQVVNEVSFCCRQMKEQTLSFGICSEDSAPTIE